MTVITGKVVMVARATAAKLLGFSESWLLLPVQLELFPWCLPFSLCSLASLLEDQALLRHFIVSAD